MRVIMRPLTIITINNNSITVTGGTAMNRTNTNASTNMNFGIRRYTTDTKQY